VNVTIKTIRESIEKILDAQLDKRSVNNTQIHTYPDPHLEKSKKEKALAV
jgi:hypothetical protein